MLDTIDIPGFCMPKLVEIGELVFWPKLATAPLYVLFGSMINSVEYL